MSAAAPSTPAPSKSPAASVSQTNHVTSTKGVEIKPNADAVRRRAYDLYLRRMAEGGPGDDKADWAQAERELKK
jgi:hypothetical protein